MKRSINKVELENYKNTLKNPDISRLIYIIRNQQVMIDSDLAALYHVETKYLNRAVKRNLERFPVQYCFQLTRNEDLNLKCQIGTSNSTINSHGGKRKLPYAFTEQGIAMLSAVLHSEESIRVSIGIIEAFVEMRHFAVNNQIMLERINSLELKNKRHKKENDNYKLHEAHSLIKSKTIKKCKGSDGHIWHTDPYLSIVRYKKNFYHDFKLNKKGTVKYKNGYNPNEKGREDEIETAHYFAKEFGWDVELVKEDSKIEGKRFVDMRFNKRWWEIKASSSFNSIDKQTEKALLQLTYKKQNEIGGFIINIYDNNSDKLNGVNNKEISKWVIDRVHRSCIVDCYAIVRRKQNIISIYKIKHK